MKLILEHEGFICETASTAKEARDWLLRDTFSAITLDLELPDEHGLSLIHELRQQAETASLPIIVISATANEGKAVINGGAVGVLDWLQKPIDMQRLKGVLLTLKSTMQSLPRCVAY